MAMVRNSENELLLKLDEFIRKYYKNQLIKGSLYTVGLLLLFYLAVVSLEYFIQFGTFVRTFLFYSYLLIAGSVFYRFIFLPMLKLARYGDVISYQEAAKIVGMHFPRVKDKLLNALQLQERLHSMGADNKTGSLVLASVHQKTNELRPVSFSSAIDFRANKKYVKMALVPIVLFLFVLFTAPSIISDGSRRLVNHATYYSPTSLFAYVVSNNELRVVQSEDFKLEVSIEGKEIPREVFIEKGEFKQILKQKNKSVFEYLFKNVQEDVEFVFVANGIVSKKYILKVLPNPLLVDFKTALTYPSYLNKKNELLSSVGDLVIPEGTSVEWVFNTLNTEQVYVGFTSSEESSRIKLLPAGNQRFFHTRLISENTAYSIVTENREVKARDSIRYWINVIPDLHPSISIMESTDSLQIQRKFFTGRAEDDYGLTRLTFNYVIVSKEAEGPYQRTEIAISKGFSKHQFFYDWSVGDLDLQPGEEVRYYFEVWDNDGYNSPKSSKSQIATYKAPSFNQISKMGEEKNEEIEKEMKAALELAKKLKKDLEIVQKKSMDKKSVSWEEKKKIREMLEAQRNLQKEVDRIKKKTSVNFKQQSELREVDKRLQEKQKALEDLMEKIMTDEMKEMYSEMDKMMENINKEQLQEMMEKMEMEAEDIEKELDRSLEIFKQLALEQKMDDVIKKLDALQEKQEELSSKSDKKDSDSDMLKKEQDKLNEEFEKLKEDLAKLDELNKELEHPNEMMDTKNDENVIQNEMKSSSNELDDGKNKKASESQKKAAEKMDELGSKLQQMQAQMGEEGEAEDMEALRQLLENLVLLSFDQEDIMEQLKGLSRKSPLLLTMTQRERKLKDDAKMVEDSLFALSKRVVQIEPLINREINLVNSNLEKTILLMQDRQLSQAASRQQYVMTSINNLALLLSEILEQMQSQSAQKKSGKESCPKPGCKKSNCQKPGHGKPSMSSMKGMQKKLSNQMKQMKDGMKSGQKGMSKKLAQMAAQQEAIRNELGRINQDLNKDGKGGMGNLEKLARLMEENEKDLVNRRITNETISRQNDILTRLLKAENAEREREKDEKRESIEGRNKDISNPRLFFEYNRAKQKEAELLKTVPPSLSPFYKLKVDEYFNNFKGN